MAVIYWAVRIWKEKQFSQGEVALEENKATTMT